MKQISRAQLAEIIVDLTDSLSAEKMAQSIAAYLVSERRTSELPQLMRDVMRIRAQKTGVVEATVTSAWPLEDTVRSHIAAMLGASQTVINNVIDPRVLGGVRVETSDTSLDLTVRGRLETLKYAGIAKGAN